MWECCAAKSMYVKSLLLCCSWESWPEESPHREELVQLRESDSLHLAGTMVRRAMKAGGENDWSELLKSNDLNAWTRVKIQECFHEVRLEDDQRKSMVQQILQKSTDFLWRIIAPVGGQGGVTLSYVYPHCHRFPIEDCIWWVSTRHGKKQCNWWCAACGDQYSWKNPNRYLVIHDSADPSKANVFSLPTPRHKVRARIS